MAEGIHKLSERERETLRLLRAGYDAKSIATQLDLSVHTINERLRDCRRKLGVSSSREAARLLAEAEPLDPNSLVYERLGVHPPARRRHDMGVWDRSAGNGYALTWLAGGMLIMSLVIAAFILSSSHVAGPAPAAQQSGASSAALSSDIASPALGPARAWLGLIDASRWGESWSAAGTLFRTSMPEGKWTSTISGVRQPLGAVTSRTLQSVTATNALPNAPAGEYAVIQFKTAFENRPASVETVILEHESVGWKVDGYFIK